MPTLAELLPPDTAPLVEDAIRKAYAKGREAERAELRGMSRLVTALNGDFGRVFKSQPFEESDHPRDHGEFAKKEGAEGAASPDDAPLASPTRFHHEVTHDEIKKRAGQLRSAVNSLRREDIDQEDFDDKLDYWQQQTEAHVGNRYKQAWQGIDAQLRADFGDKVESVPAYQSVRQAVASAREEGVSAIRDLVEEARKAGAGTEHDFEEALGNVRTRLDNAHTPIYTALKVVRDHLAGGKASEYKLGRYLKAWDKSQHPRGDDGKFVDAGDLAAAKSDPKKAAELRSQVTDPTERKKLEDAIGEPKDTEPNNLPEPPTDPAEVAKTQIDQRDAKHKADVASVNTTLDRLMKVVPKTVAEMKTLMTDRGVAIAQLAALVTEGRAITDAYAKLSKDVKRGKYDEGEPKKRKPRVKKAWKSDEHPRDDHGRFVDAHDMHEAMTNPEKAKELRAKVTKPEERAKLDAAIGAEEKAPEKPKESVPSGVDAAQVERLRSNLAGRSGKSAGLVPAGDGRLYALPEGAEHLRAAGLSIRDDGTASVDDVRAAISALRDAGVFVAVPKGAIPPVSASTPAKAGKPHHEMTKAEWQSAYDAAQNEHRTKNPRSKVANPPGFHGTHLQAVTEAMQTGKTIPDDVRREYPHLLHSHEMTQEQHDAHFNREMAQGGPHAPSATDKVPGQSYTWGEHSRRNDVERALAAGKPVPPEVLADYPDLAPAPPPAAAGPETPAKPKVEYVRAKAGGQTSDVDGKFYKGGQLMPVHGLYSGQVKPPKGQGVGVASTPAKPDPDKEGGSRRQPAQPLTPEEIEDRRRQAEDRQKWTEMNKGPLGRITWLGESPNAKAAAGIHYDKWKDYAASIGPEGVKRIIETLEPVFHSAVDTGAKAIRDGGQHLSADTEEWAKGQPKTRAEEDMGMFRGKKHEKEVPGSHYARQLIGEMLDAQNSPGLSQVERLHLLHSMLTQATSPPTS